MAKKKAKGPDARGKATRERIVAAAVKAFAEKGFEAASTRDIAQRAGTDQGLLTYHFPSKDLLWRAAANRIFGEFEKRLEPIITSLEFKDSRERSRAAIREYVRFSAANPEAFRFMVDEGNRSSSRTRWLVDTHLKPRFEFMKTLGVVRVNDIDEALAPHVFYTLAAAGALIFAIGPNCRRLSGVDPRKKETVEAHAEYVARLMVP